MEIVRFPSGRGFSVRSIFTFALAALITALLWILLAGTPANAADATWSGSSIEHDGRSYYLVGTTQSDNTMGIPADSMYYASLEKPTTTPAPTLQKAHVIYLAPGASPPGDGTATYALYDYDTSTKEFSNASGTKSITIDPNMEAQVTTCAVEGVGWIVCPVMNFLAWGMDIVFDILADFMKVQPIETGNTQGSLYNAWNAMRNVANIVFIISFLIIIYSQITNVQVSNYGIKRLLPRLIIAAIAINLSYIICALAVDASNILGFSIHQVFLDMRNGLLNTGVPDPNATDTMMNSWQSVTGFALSAGSLATGAIIGVGSFAFLAAGGSALSAVFLLLPALVGLLLTVLVVLLILAARQALIVILVIIAPLALVAYLLPNTDKWFGKWRDLFMTMLIFFPAFSVVLGGSQLAGAVIIQNASSLNMLILGMIVQVAPLVITPLLLKLSGTVLGGIARLVNDPNKGVIDRTRNWSKGHADWHANRGRGGLDKRGNPRMLKDKNGNIKLDKNGNPVSLGAGNVARKSARYLDQRKRRLSERTANAETATQTAYENSNRYSKDFKYGKKAGTPKFDMAVQKATLDELKNKTHSDHAAHVDHARRTQGSMLYKPNLSAAESKDRAQKQQDETARFMNTVRTNERFASRVGASALFNSSYGAEVSKDRLAASESLKTAFYNNERADSTTGLGKTVFKVEASKLKADTAQNLYTASVDTMKGTPGTRLNIIAEKAESSKEHLEYAQSQLQKFFDTQRANPSTDLGQSTIQLEKGKSYAENAKNKLTTYLNEERTDGTLKYQTILTERSKSQVEASEANLKTHLAGQKSDGLLREQTFVTEQAKYTQQQSDLKLTRIVEELKGGGGRDVDEETGRTYVTIDGKRISDAERAIAKEMYATTEMISAETTGIQSAKNEAQQRVSTILATEEPGDDATKEQLLTYARAEQLLNIAGSIDDNGQQRALANALAQRSKSRSEVLNNISSIIGFRNFSTSQIRTLAEGGEVEGIKNSHDVTAAAIQMTFGGKDNGQIVEALKNIDFSFPEATPEEREELQILAADALSSNGSRPPFLSAGVIAGLKAGNRFDSTPDNPVKFDGAYGKQGLNELILANLNAGKLDSKKLQTAGKDYVQPIWDAIEQDRDALDFAQQTRLMRSLAQTLNPSNEASEGLADSVVFLENIFRKYGGKLDKNGVPIIPPEYKKSADEADDETDTPENATDDTTPQS